jgi:hypothetical protein
MVRLFHFSEEPDIEVFAPRAPLAHLEHEALVWAVDEWHSPHYFTPRDCPRVCFWAGPDSPSEAILRYLGSANRVIAIEPEWSEALKRTTLYRYEFDPGPFEKVDDFAGYYVCREVVRPLSVEALEDLPSLITGQGVELRLQSHLYAFHWEIVGSGLAFSGNRLRNAKDYWGEGPLPKAKEAL